MQIRRSSGAAGGHRAQSECADCAVEEAISIPSACHQHQADAPAHSGGRGGRRRGRSARGCWKVVEGSRIRSWSACSGQRPEERCTQMDAVRESSQRRKQRAHQQSALISDAVKGGHQRRTGFAAARTAVRADREQTMPALATCMQGEWMISMQAACKQHASSMQSACNQHALSMHSACTQHAISMQSPRSSAAP